MRNAVINWMWRSDMLRITLGTPAGFRDLRWIKRDGITYSQHTIASVMDQHLTIVYGRLAALEKALQTKTAPPRVNDA